MISIVGGLKVTAEALFVSAIEEASISTTRSEVSIIPSKLVTNLSLLFLREVCGHKLELSTSSSRRDLAIIHQTGQL